MAAAVTNTLKLTWGSFVVGGTTERLLVGIHRLSRTFDAWELTCDVLVRGTSDSTFAANCAEMESEFSKRRLSILFEVGSSTVHTFNPSGSVNTGLNSYARIDKAGTPGADTVRSRLYTITVGCELPATDTSGRRDATITVEYDPAERRMVTINGTWTAVTTSNATAQYAAQIEAYCTSTLGALLPSATFERVAQQTRRDDQDKVLTFSRTYSEVIRNQSVGTLDNASIKAPTLAFARSIDQPGDSGGGGVKRLETITAQFSCWLDKTASLDVQALYTDTVRPFIVSEFESAFSPSQYAILSESPTHIPFTNQLTVTVAFAAAIDPTDVIESVVTNRIVEASEVRLTGAWVGKLFAKYVDHGIGTRRRFGIRAVRVLGSIKPIQRVGGEGGTVFGVNFVNPNGGLAAGTLEAGGPVPEGGIVGGGRPGINGWVDANGGGRWVLIDNDSAATPKWLGQPGGEQIAVTDMMDMTVEEWVVDP